MKWLVIVNKDGGGVDEVMVMRYALDHGDDIDMISWSAGQLRVVDRSRRGGGRGKGGGGLARLSGANSVKDLRLGF